MLILECSQGCYGRTDGSVSISLHNFVGQGIIKQQWTIEEISIFSNSSHLEWRVGLSDTILIGTHPGTIPARFGLICLRGFRREDLNVKIYDVRIDTLISNTISIDGCYQCSRNCLPFQNTHVHSGFLCCSIFSFLCSVLQIVVFFLLPIVIPFDSGCPINIFILLQELKEKI